MSTPSIAIIIGSTRPQRRGEGVGRWVYEQAQTRDDATFDLIDLAEVGLPLYDEPKPAGAGNYTQLSAMLDLLVEWATLLRSRRER